jgi:hypothetical protein
MLSAVRCPRANKHGNDLEVISVDEIRGPARGCGRQPPYAMVGASRGGVLERLFQAEYPPTSYDLC